MDKEKKRFRINYCVTYEVNAYDEMDAIERAQEMFNHDFGLFFTDIFGVYATEI